MTPDELARLHAASFVSPRPWTAAEFASLLEGPGSFLLIEDEGFLVGRALAGEAEMLTLAVPLQVRRAGIGRRLVERFIDAARGRGADTAFLEVADDNAAALALYRATGWTVAGRRKGYYAHDDGRSRDALVLARRLKQE